MDELERIAPESEDLEDLAEPREPTALERAFFTPLHKPSSPWQVVGWWESRRFLYNAVVGGAGAVTMIAAAVFGGANGPPPGAFIIVPLVYGVAANLGYTLGWIVDLTLRKWLGRHADWAGPALLRYGFVFSVGLTLLPIPLFVFSWLVRTFFLR
jgi:hypothetical protein